MILCNGKIIRKQMTMLDWWKEHGDGEDVIEKGYCPLFRYSLITQKEVKKIFDYCAKADEHDCEACWNQPFLEEEYYEVS